MKHIRTQLLLFSNLTQPFVWYSVCLLEVIPTTDEEEKLDITTRHFTTCTTSQVLNKRVPRLQLIVSLKKIGISREIFAKKLEKL